MAKATSNPALLRKLSTFVGEASSSTFEKGRFHECCVRASLAKAFALATEAHASRKTRISFFLVPSLRSICEDLIVLGYMAKIDHAARDELSMILITHELRRRSAIQGAFFQKVRPDQPILRVKDESIEQLEAQARSIWQKNGWPKLRNGLMPNVRQIAEKHHFDLLTTVYDYLYRLTSGMVHFNPQVLLRTGWGPNPVDVTFSPKNFESYYQSFARTYGLMLLCLYFELFDEILKPDRKANDAVRSIRANLIKESRWPEMVTYEEMNRKPPTGQEVLRLLVRIQSAQQYENGFLTRKDDNAEQGIQPDDPASGGSAG